jgi:transposase-like protein
MTTECPICGSTNLEKKISSEILKGDLGEDISYTRTSYKCRDCESESEGDYSEKNADAINFALSSLKKEYIKSTLDYFIDNKISFSSIERILNLPQRTLTKWKNDVAQPSAAGIALLKFLRVFPWLLDIAEHSYDYDISQKIFLQSAFNALLHKISFLKNDIMEMGVFMTNKSNLIYVYTERNETLPNKNILTNTSYFPETNQDIFLGENGITLNNQRHGNEIKLFSYL